MGLEKKNISCYACKKNRGIAKKVSGMVWTAVGFKRFGMRLWLCNQCNNNRCKKCDIILNNKVECRCGVDHGATHKMNPNYCRLCFDIREKGRNQNINN